MKFKIQQKEDQDKGVFFIEKEGKMAVELEYTLTDNGVMTLDHTEAKPEMKGTGAAGELIKHSVEYAKKHHLKIDPLCDYAAYQFERHEEYQEVQV